MIMLKVLIPVVAIAALAGQIMGQDASSMASSYDNIKALGAAQIGPSFRNKRDENGRQRRGDSDMEEMNLLTDAKENVERTGQEIRQVLLMHQEALNKGDYQDDTESESSDSDSSDVQSQTTKIEEDDTKHIEEKSHNSLDEDEAKADNTDDKEVSADDVQHQTTKIKDDGPKKIEEMSHNSVDEGETKVDLDTDELAAGENNTSVEQPKTKSHNETDETVISHTTNVNNEVEEANNDVAAIHKKSSEPEINESSNQSKTEETLLPPMPFDSSNGKLKKLMMESVEVAKELQNVFKILAEREAKLMEEVIQLKEALTGAVAIVSAKSKSGTSEAIRRCKRSVARRSHRSAKDDPYTACVYIESSAPDYSSRAGSSSSTAQKQTLEKNDEIYPPEPSVRIYFPEDTNSTNEADYEEHEETSDEETHEDHHLTTREEEELEESHKKSISHSSHSSSSSLSGDDIDLSKVYWLKLPATEGNDESIMEHKVEEVIAEVKEDGKDALIIPVSRGLNSPTKDSKTGFIKPVKPIPALQKKLKRHLRRSIKSSHQQFKHKHGSPSKY